MERAVNTGKSTANLRLSADFWQTILPFLNVRELLKLRSITKQIQEYTTTRPLPLFIDNVSALETAPTAKNPSSLQSLLAKHRVISTLKLPTVDFKTLRQEILPNLPEDLEIATMVMREDMDFSEQVLTPGAPELSLWLSCLQHLKNLEEFSLEVPSFMLNSLKTEEISGIYNLNFTFTDLVNLRDHGKHLKSLKLAHALQITNFEVLADFAQLETLDVSYTSFNDRALKLICENCPHLQRINLAFCEKLTDFNPLSKLKRLVALNANGTTINDQHLANICKNNINLEDLRASNCGRLNDFSPLENLSNLQILHLENTQLSSPNLLAHSRFWPKLKILKVERQILKENWAILANLPALMELDLTAYGLPPDTYNVQVNRNLADLPFFDVEDHELEYLCETCTNLQRLILNANTRLQNFSSLKKLTKLTHLSLADTPITFTALNALSVVSNEQETPLEDNLEAGCYFLRFLNLAGCEQLTETETWPHLPQLKTVYLSHTPITDISLNSLIDTYPGLTCLKIDHCTEIGDYSSLGNLEDLEELDISQTNTSRNDLNQIIRYCQKLQSLSIMCCDNLFPLETYITSTSLTHLLVDYNQDTTENDIIALTFMAPQLKVLGLTINGNFDTLQLFNAFTNLRELYLNGNLKVTDEQLEECKQNLPNLETLAVDAPDPEHEEMLEYTP